MVGTQKNKVMDIIIATAFVVIISFSFGYYAGKEESKKSAEETIK